MVWKVVHAEDSEEMPDPAWWELARRPGSCVPARVVLEDGRVIAIGSMSMNTLHPVPRHFDYRLAESASPNCLTPLLEALVRDLGPEGKRAVHISISSDDAHAVAWAEQAGFEPIMTTWIGVLIPPTASLEPVNNLHRLSDHDIPGVRRSLAELHEYIYRRNHQWNPPVHILPDMAENLFMDDRELLPEYLWYALDERGNLIGVSSLRKTDSLDVLDFGWIGVMEGAADDVHRALFEAAVGSATNHEIAFEVDENDQLTLRLANELPVSWSETIVRYERLIRSPSE